MEQDVHCGVRVVFVHQDAALTGSAISMINLINGFQNRVIAHVVMPEPGVLEGHLQKNGIAYSIHPFVRFWTFPGPRLHQKSHWQQLAALRPSESFRDHVLELQPDVIHLNDKACLHAGISLASVDVPIVQHLRSSYFPTYSRMLKLLSRTAIKKYADYIIAISEDELDGFEGEENTSIIFNSADLHRAEHAIAARERKREELGIAPDVVAIGYVSAINGRKGAWDFLEMAREILMRGTKAKVRFLLAGEAGARGGEGKLAKLGLRKSEVPQKRLEEYLSDRELQGKVNVFGFRKDNLEIIAALDVLVVCTRLGVLGRQPFEAMAVKTPVVVTAGHSGKSTVVLHEKTGIVVPMKDVEALTDAVSRLIEDPALRERLAEEGFEYAQREFNPVRNSSKVLQVYYELTNPMANKPSDTFSPVPQYL
jgi:glycosyltransferase involved in cell wall biosynthesis